MNVEAVKKLADGALSDGGWATKTASELIGMVVEYEESGTVATSPLKEVGGTVDPLEAYCRAQSAAAVAVQLELLLPALWVHAGAVGQGGWWAAWNGREHVQCVPLIDHHIGLAKSGAGKTTMQKLNGTPFSRGMESGLSKVKDILNALAIDQRAAIDASLADWKADCNATPDKEESAQYNLVKGILQRAVDTVSLSAVRRTTEAGGGSNLSDATMEAMVSLASDVGGAILVRASEQDLLDNLTRYSAAGQSGSLSVLTQGWDGEPYSRMRKGSGTEDVPSLMLSLTLMTQDESFTKMFNGPAGMALLDKGVLGRCWLTRGVDVDQMDVTDQELAKLQDAKDGVEGVGMDAGPLGKGFARIARAGAESRALRAIEGRVESAALSDKSAAGLPDKSAIELKKAAAALELAPGRAVSAQSIVNNAGAAGALAGIVLGVDRKTAIKLESLFVLCKLLSEGDPVLAPSLTRYVSHVVRVAGIRAMTWAATTLADDEWEAWLGKSELPEAWIADTAERVCVWWMRQHLAVTAEMRGERAATETRAETLKTSQHADTSLEGLAAKRMAQNAVILPLGVGVLSDLLSRWGGMVPNKDRTMRRRVFKDMFCGLEGMASDYFVVSKKAPAQGGPAALTVEPGPRYLDLMRGRATG